MNCGADKKPDGLAGAAVALTGFSVRHRWWVFAAVLLVVVLSGLTAQRHLQINTDNLDMIDPEVPFRRANLEFREAFAWYGNQLVVVIDAEAPELADRAARDLAAHMRARPELYDHVLTPGLDPFLRQHALLFLPPEQLQDLLDQLAASQGLLATLAEQPDLTGLLSMLTLALPRLEPGSPEARRVEDLLSVLADMAEEKPGAPTYLSWRQQMAVEGQGGLEGRQIVLAKPVQNFASLSPAKAAIADLRALIETQPANVTYRLTGNAALNTEELQSVKLGGSSAGLVSLAGILLLLMIGLGRPRPVLATLAVLIAGLVISLGFATVAVGQLNLLSVAFAVLFIGLAVDFSLHFCLRVREVGGGDAATGQAARSVGGSLTLSALAAAIGFLSFLPTDYRGLAELGIIAGGSMAIALFLNLTLLPALLGTREIKPMIVRGSGLLRPRLKGLTLTLPTVALVGGCVWLIATEVRFDPDPINLKDPRTESVSTWLELAESGGAAYAIDALAAPDFDARAVEADLKQAARGGRVLWLDRFVPQQQDEKLAALEGAALFLFPVLNAVPQPTPDDDARRAAVEAFAPVALESGGVAARLAEALSTRTAAELARFEMRVTDLLPDWLDDIRLSFEAGPVTRETLPPSLTQLWLTDDGRQRVQVFPGEPFSEVWTLSHFARDVQAILPQATGSPVMVTGASDAVLGSFREATVIAALAVMLLIGLILRRVSDVLLTAAPVALAALLMLGVTALAGLSLNFANVIVLPLLFGLGVASSIHIVMRWRLTGSTDTLLTSSTPRAVLFSALTTLASFVGLALSPHLGMASMGLLLTIAILCLLFCTLVWLPWVLLLLDRRTTRN